MERVNSFNIFRKKYNLTLIDASSIFNIPYRTIQNWTYDVSTPPEYVLRFMTEIMENKREFEHIHERLEFAQDLIHDNRISEAIEVIDNI